MRGRPVDEQRVAQQIEALLQEEQKLYKTGQDAFQTLCAACHGMDGKGMPMAGAAPGAMLAPALAGSKTVIGWREGPIHVDLSAFSAAG